MLGSCAASEAVGGRDQDVSVVVFMGFEKIVMRLDRLMWRLLRMGRGRAVNGGGDVKTLSRRMFGLPVKTERQWRRLAEKIKRKERRRDMKHWKEHFQEY